jgi:hypothetical protein
MVSVPLPQPRDNATEAAEGLIVKLPVDVTVTRIVAVPVVVPEVPVTVTV